MPSNPRRPILYKGEEYSHAIEKRRSIRPRLPEITYEEARGKMLNDVNNLREQLNRTDPRLHLPNESIVCVRVHEDFAAKTYYPGSIFYPANQSSDLQEIGSRLWIPDDTEKNQNFSKFFYIRTTRSGLDKFYEKLSGSSRPTEIFKADIRRLAGFELPQAAERLSGFNADWEDGLVEVTLHPFLQDRSRSLSHFRELISGQGVDVGKIRIKQYDPEGLTFISLPGNKKLLEELSAYNPLRAAHPLEMRILPAHLRATFSAGCPAAPVFTNKSSVVIGVLDGGYIPGNPALDPYVEIVDELPPDPTTGLQDHGTCVTGAILYGPLHTFRDTDTLTEPDITVRNFKVLSELSEDEELYDVIDRIEKIVPSNPDIQVYNLSLGPAGPVIDTDVHRFTYALDLLSKQYNVLFCVAVGNDGNSMHGYDRIQSPSDMVNGLAVGAYTLADGTPKRASYSCVGPGREGNKLKPDITALGGCDRMKIQLIAASPGHRAYTMGSSFAAPLAARLTGRLIGRSHGVIDSLISRALTLHQAESMADKKHCLELGHGTLPESLDNMMHCSPRSYTLIFNGELQHGKYRQFTIPWPPAIKSGSVHFRWSVAVQTSVDPNSPEDYTSSSVELYFYPNAYKYYFDSPDGKKHKTVDIRKKPDTARKLTEDGWIKSKTPASENSPKQFAPEGELRKDLKWDTIDTRNLTKRAISIEEPAFQVHALGRGHRSAGKKVKFAIVFTVETTKTDVDIYPEILNQYPALLPVQIELPISVNVQA